MIFFKICLKAVCLCCSITIVLSFLLSLLLYLHFSYSLFLPLSFYPSLSHISPSLRSLSPFSLFLPFSMSFSLPFSLSGSPTLSPFSLSLCPSLSPFLYPAPPLSLLSLFLYVLLSPLFSIRLPHSLSFLSFSMSFSLPFSLSGSPTLSPSLSPFLYPARPLSLLLSLNSMHSHNFSRIDNNDSLYVFQSQRPYAHPLIQAQYFTSAYFFSSCSCFFFFFV